MLASFSNSTQSRPCLAATWQMTPWTLGVAGLKSPEVSTAAEASTLDWMAWRRILKFLLLKFRCLHGKPQGKLLWALGGKSAYKLNRFFKKSESIRHLQRWIWNLHLSPSGLPAVSCLKTQSVWFEPHWKQEQILIHLWQHFQYVSTGFPIIFSQS